MNSERFNLISLILVLLFAAPVLTGLFFPLTLPRLVSTLGRLAGTLLTLLSAGAAVFFTQALFSSEPNALQYAVVRQVPALGEALRRKDGLAWILIFVTALLLCYSLLRLLLLPLGHLVLRPLGRKLRRVRLFGKGLAPRLLGALWQAPRGAAAVLLAAAVCAGYIALSGNEVFEAYARRSGVYRMVEEKVLSPLAGTEIVRRIPDKIDDVSLSLARSLSQEGRRLLIPVFINGETVENAVRASPAINNTAIDLVRGCSGKMERARRLYDWVCANIAYDEAKLRALDEDPFQLSSGAVPAFSERRGICFDIASLYAAMCRAVHVPVRLVTGEALGGDGWVSHAWNEVYDPEADRWVPVDATFGLGGGDYFDSPGFWLDHREPVIQGQWP